MLSHKPGRLGKSHMKLLLTAKKNSLEKTGTKKRIPSHVIGCLKSTLID